MSASSQKGNFLDAIQGTTLRAQRMGDRTHDFGRIFTAVLFALFMFTLLLAIITGARVYGALADLRTQASDERLATNLIANYVRNADAVGAISAGQGPEGPALVLTERLETGTFESRLYLHDGAICEEYAAAGMDYDPAGATRIVDSSTFAFELKDGVLTVTTDLGITDVALHTAQGGE